MTHEELLARINEGIHCWQTDIDEGMACRECQPNLALIAVVELHKPSDSTWDDGFICCETCNYEYDRNEPYPCPTIRAIQEQLK